jgi:hypothetical protein
MSNRIKYKLIHYWVVEWYCQFSCSRNKCFTIFPRLHQQVHPVLYTCSGVLYASCTQLLLLHVMSAGVQPSLLTLRPSSVHNGTSNRSSGSSHKSDKSSSSPPSDRRLSSPDTDDENRVIFKVGLNFSFWVLNWHSTFYYILHALASFLLLCAAR